MTTLQEAQLPHTQAQGWADVLADGVMEQEKKHSLGNLQGTLLGREWSLMTQYVYRSDRSDST